MNDYALLYQSVLDHPTEDTPKLVLADWLDKNGRHKEAQRFRWMAEDGTGPHIWSDISCHGSPRYACDVCHIDRDEALTRETCGCLRFVVHQLSRLQEVERAERREYAELKAQRDRWTYLHAKYGSPASPADADSGEVRDEENRDNGEDRPKRVKNRRRDRHA